MVEHEDLSSPDIIFPFRLFLLQFSFKKNIIPVLFDIHFLTFFDNSRWILCLSFNFWTFSCSLAFHISSVWFSYFNSVMVIWNSWMLYFPATSYVLALCSSWSSSDAGLFRSIESLGFLGLVPYLCPFEDASSTMSFFTGIVKMIVSST